MAVEPSHENPVIALLVNLSWISPLVGVEQIVGVVVHIPFSDWRVGVVSVVLGPIFLWLATKLAGMGVRQFLGNILRRLIRLGELESQLIEQKSDLGQLESRLSDLHAKADATSITLEEIKSAVQMGPLQPTVEMLEAGRQKTQASLSARINVWRGMVAELHKFMPQEDGSGSIVSPAIHYLEQDERFLSLRPHLSDHTKTVLWSDRTFVVPPDTRSTMDYGLRCVLDDIDAIAKQWGVV